MLHQGRSTHKNHPYERIVFVETGHQNYGIHYCTISGKILLIQIDEFIREVLDGCRMWLKDVEGKEPFITNYASFACRHASGIAPYIIGPPVIG